MVGQPDTQSCFYRKLICLTTAPRRFWTQRTHSDEMLRWRASQTKPNSVDVFRWRARHSFCLVSFILRKHILIGTIPQIGKFAQIWRATHRQAAPVCAPNANSSRWRTAFRHHYLQQNVRPWTALYWSRKTTFDIKRCRFQGLFCDDTFCVGGRHSRDETVREHQQEMEQERIPEPSRLRSKPLLKARHDDRQGHRDPVLEHRQRMGQERVPDT